MNKQSNVTGSLFSIPVAILSLGLMLFSSNAVAQTKVVRGNVTTLNHLRIRNIDVIAKKAKSHVKTDSIGEFVIVCHDNDVLIFEGKVFTTRKVKIKPSTNDSVNVKLQFIPSEKNQEIAVGYGYMTKNQMTTAVSYMENNNDEYCHFNSIFDLISGRLTGVQVMAGGGEPQVIIRGQGSLNLSNCALYVVDGVVVNSISSITPCHVKRIDVIKDGSAAIYGSRGANGVVIIETYRGPRQ